MAQEKMDRRVRRTKALLLQGLIQLMEEKDIKDISVKELSDLADINRGTFYLHYSDVYNMLGKIEEELFQEFFQTRREDIKWEIVLRYSGMIKSIALRLQDVYANFAQLDDIINEGLITLADTVEKYDPAKGGFSTYASIRIRGMIIDYAKKEIRINEEFYPSSDIEKDMKYVKKFYTNSANAARYPEKFTI